MKLALILDPLDSLKIYKDSSYAMMRAAAARGHRLFVMQQEDIILRDRRVTAFAAELTLTDDEPCWYRLKDRTETSLTQFDSVLMRKDPPFDQEYLYSTYLLEQAEKEGARIFNRPRAIRDCNEKLTISAFPLFTVPTLVTRQMALIGDFLAAENDIILKPLDAMGGRGIFRIRRGDPNTNVIVETLTQQGQRTIMAQRYIPDIAQGDKRILLIDGEPAPYALARIPKAGETRGNLAVGGTGVAQPLSARDWEIATAVGPWARAQGLLLTGLDVIGNYLTEINVTSPTGMVEIAAQTPCNTAEMVIDALERQC